MTFLLPPGIKGLNIEVCVCEIEFFIVVNSISRIFMVDIRELTLSMHEGGPVGFTNFSKKIS